MDVTVKEDKPSIDVDDWEAHTIANYNLVDHLHWREDDPTTFSHSNDEALDTESSPETGRGDPLTICKACSKVPIRQMLLAHFRDDLHDKPLIKFDLLRALSKRSYCALCRLVINALYQDPNWKILESLEKAPPPRKRPQYGLRAVNQCIEIPTSIGLTGEIRVLDEDYPLFESRLQLRKRRFPSLEQDWLARRTLLTQQLDLGLLRDWLDTCEQDHEKCSAVDAAKDSDGTPSAPIKLILIDVHLERLVEATSEFRYVALSYVMGQAKVLNTVKANYAALQQEGALSTLKEQIPQVVQTAMELVGNMGERYLWVDALCIIKDGEDKLPILQQMDLIYSQARMTIFALGGTHADIPLAGVRPGSRRLNQGIEMLQGVRCVATSPSLEKVLRSSFHSTRGWTYQEYLLSTRCLFLTDQHAYFRCLSETWSEDHVSTINDGILNPLDQLRHKPLKTYFPYYEMLVQDYTRRDLTFDTDITNAFAGITSAITRFSSVECAASLPLRCICHAMLFMPIGKAKRRPRAPIEKGGEYFPSWSWTGWLGSVTYELVWLWNQHDLFPIRSTLKDFKVQDMYGVRAVEPFTATAKEAHAEICSFKFLEEKTFDKSNDTSSKLQIPANLERSGKIVLSFLAPAVPAIRFRFGESTHQRLTSQSDIKYLGLPIYDDEDHQCGAIFGPEFPADLPDRLPNCQLVIFGYFCRWGSNRPDVWPSEKEADVFGDYYLKSVTWCGCVSYVLLIEKQDGGGAERLAIGQIHPEAWAKVGVRQELIRLV